MPKNPQNLHQPTYSHLQPGLDTESLAFAGIVAGLGLGAVLTRLLSNQLYKLSGADPLTFTAVSLFLMAVALVASYIPARRAMRMDPIATLRYE